MPKPEPASHGALPPFPAGNGAISKSNFALLRTLTTCHGPFVLCNARVEEASQWQKGREGCMSVPDLTGDVKRAGRLVVVGEVPGTGEERRIVTDAFEARALQHEIDHCAGLLFLDRVAGAHAIYARKVYL